MFKVMSAVFAAMLVSGCLPTGEELQKQLSGVPGSNSGVDVDSVDGRDSTAFAAASHRHQGAEIDGKVASAAQADSATVADSAKAVAWADVSGKPADFATLVTGKVPAATVADSANAVAWAAVSGKPDDFSVLVTGKVPSATVADSANAVTWANVTGKPTDLAPLVTGKVPAATVADSANAVAWTAVSGKPADFSVLVTGKVPSATVADSANAVTWANVSGKPTACKANSERAGNVCIDVATVVRSPKGWREALDDCRSQEGALCRLLDAYASRRHFAAGEWTDQLVFDDVRGYGAQAVTYSYDNTSQQLVVGSAATTESRPYRCCFPVWGN